MARITLGKLETDIYGDPKREIPGALKDIKELQDFRQDVLDFQNRVSGSIDGAKWAFGFVFALLGIIIYMLQALLASPLISAGSSLAPAAAMADVGAPAGVQLPELPGPDLPVDEPFELDEFLDRLEPLVLDPLDLVNGLLFP